MIGERRLGSLFQGLSAVERARMAVQAWKDDRSPDRLISAGMHADQAAEFGRLMSELDGAQAELTRYALWLRARVETVQVRIAWLMTMQIWALSTNPLAKHTRCKSEAARQVVARAPRWLAEEDDSCEGHSRASEIARLIVERSRLETEGIWSELPALDSIASTVAGDLDGEDPLHPESRELLEEVRRECRAAAVDLEGYSGAVAWATEGDQGVVDALLHLIRERAQ